MDVNFSIGFQIDPDADELLYADADDVLKNRDEYDQYIKAYEFGYELGAITIKSEDQETIIKDTLRYLVLQLCFQAVPILLKDETFTFKYFDSPSTVQLLPQGDRVYISGKWVNSLVCPRMELVEKLYACGMGYLDFVRKLDGAYEAYITHHVEESDKARQAIEATGKGNS